MSSPGSVSDCLARLKAGDRAAAQRLYENYIRRLVGLARKKLHGGRRRMADEEDVAQDALASFFRGAENGRFPQLHDRNDLWGLLVVITERKALDLLQHERRRKRRDDALRGESAFRRPPGSGAGPDGLDQLAGREPPAALAAQMSETCRRLMDSLESDELRSVALWKLEGYTNEEIAARLGCVVSTVERKLRVIRNIWSQEGSR
jgi:RNA polymerase sigma factor (sigma-70 family)